MAKKKQRSPLDDLVEDLRVEYERGDGYALLGAIERVLPYDCPEWIINGFVAALHDYERKYARTLDEAFKVSRPAGKHWDAAVREERDAVKVAFYLARLIVEGAPRSNATFDRVAREFGLGRRSVREFWKKHGAIAEKEERAERERKKAAIAEEIERIRRSEPNARKRAALVGRLLAENAKGKKPR